ncbi:hypothetical protein P43SY_007175 [Pythium insidiosum]|uniref:Uncharacterized protein n=1 Tax=Pythium insidiosum TaxID=114742 RepID=A0AAD5Q630_PYTIN|nr:hypothetical protein P43SY_007175 [Pythium insidiosum]
MMYSGGGGGNAARIYNPRPDPLERGPPKRVNRDESHIGEMVAASKKRISWTFTLGDAETVHEVVLVHSVMSYKKVVEFDGRQMHYSATATPGDWSFVMILDGTNNVIEVRINDLESADVPKYVSVSAQQLLFDPLASHAQPGYGGGAMGMPQQAKVAGAANFNISQLMNPMEVNNVRNPQQTKTIDIDPFAVIKQK